MRSFPFYQAFVFAFFSAELYRDVARRWRGIGLGYLLALLALIWIPTALDLRGDMRALREDVAPPIIRQVPRIAISDGVAVVAGETPRTIVAADGTPLLLIDLDAGVEALEASGAQALLTRERLYVGDGPQARVFDLDALDGLTVDQAFLTDMANTISRLVATFAYPIGVLASFVYRLTQALLFAVLGLILANTMGLGLPYAALVRLSAVALTPVIVLRTLQALLGFTLPLWWLVAFAAFVAYLYFGLQAVRDAPLPPIDPDAVASDG